MPETLTPAPSSDAARTAETNTIIPDTAQTSAAAENSIPDVKEVAASADAEKVVTSAAEKEVVKPLTLLDAVRSAVEPVKAEVTTAADKVEQTAQTADPEKPVATDTPPAETEKQSDEKLPFGKHPRWQAVIRERDSYKARASEYDQITEYMTTNGLETAEVARGFEIMAAMKNDPARAAKMLNEHLAMLSRFTGDVLPEDLTKRVEDGLITKDAAKELAGLRERERFTHERNAKEAEQASYQAQANAYVQSQKAMAQAVTAWEGNTQTRDADYARKQPLILDRARALIASEKPATPVEAVTLMERALAEVNATVKAFIPARQPATVTKSAQSSSTSKATPTTLREVIERAAKVG